MSSRKVLMALMVSVVLIFGATALPASGKNGASSNAVQCHLPESNAEALVNAVKVRTAELLLEPRADDHRDDPGPAQQQRAQKHRVG